jgi:NitT/TauT family transport system permease protein
MRMRSVLIRSLALCIPFLLWESASRFEWVDSRFLPPPSRVLPWLTGQMQGGELFTHAGSSLFLITVGVCLSVLAGTTVGILISQSNLADDLISPNIELIRGIAPLALWPAFMLLFGIGAKGKIAMIFWVSWIPVLISTVQAIRSIAPEHLRVAKLFKASRWQVINTIYFPSGIPFFVVGLRIAIGNAFLAIVAAEMIGSSSGLGFFILEASQTFRLTEMYGAIVLIALIGLILNALLMLCEAQAGKWRRQ